MTKSSADLRSPLIARRMERVSSFLAMDVLSAAAAKERRGDTVIHMEVGQPSAPAPRAAREAAKAALDLGRIGYTEALGISALRERIARHYRDTYGVSIAPERVVVTTGSSAGFVLAFLSLFDHGQRVAITAPGYPAYRNILEALGIEPVTIPLTKADGWIMTAEAIEKAHAEKPLHGILAMSPANPSGTMIGRKALAELGETCRRLGLWFVSDEIYHGLTYSEAASTALASDDDAVVINSFSKYYCMTGWRIGWIVVPERLVRPIETAGAKPLHLAALSLAGGRARGLRRGGRTRGGEGGIRQEPRLSAGGAAEGRHLGDAPRGRGLLHLRRHRPLHERFHRLLEAHAGGGRRRCDAGARLRSHRRFALPASVLRRLGERLPRDGGTAEGLVEVVNRTVIPGRP